MIRKVEKSGFSHSVWSRDSVGSNPTFPTLHGVITLTGKRIDCESMEISSSLI